MPTFWPGYNAFDFRTNKVVAVKRKNQQTVESNLSFGDSKRLREQNSQSMATYTPPPPFVNAYKTSLMPGSFAQSMSNSCSSPIDVAGTNIHVQNNNNNNNEVEDVEMEMEEASTQEVNGHGQQLAPALTEAEKEAIRAPERTRPISPETVRQFVMSGGYSPRQMSFCNIPYSDIERCCGFRSEFY